MYFKSNISSRLGILKALYHKNGSLKVISYRTGILKVLIRCNGILKAKHHRNVYFKSVLAFWYFKRLGKVKHFKSDLIGKGTRKVICFIQQHFKSRLLFPATSTYRVRYIVRYDS